MPKEKPKVNIGQVIRAYRGQRGLSQGDIERRTGLLRCYLSRVENGHTVPSLETLAKIAEAMDIALADFFPGAETQHDRETQKMLGELSEDEIRFLSEIKKHSSTLSDGDKRSGASDDPKDGHNYSAATACAQSGCGATARILIFHFYGLFALSVGRYASASSSDWAGFRLRSRLPAVSARVTPSCPQRRAFSVR